ncbi:cytochrome b-c1 complex subunit 10 [Mrakia frigida]|uniref:ubiquinol--cytochrome-c reductase subunit 10 n=1 Tax=Mrakia frigida TaxID=29902 RepID=UPI003FCC0BFF
MSGRVVFSKTPMRLGPITPEKVMRWSPALVGWGVVAGAGITLFMSATPIFKRDVLQKVPLLGEHFTDKTPDCDKPF